MALLQFSGSPRPVSCSTTCLASSVLSRSTSPLYISPCFASLAQHSPSFLQNAEHAVLPPLRSIKLPVPPSQPSVFAEEADQLVARRAHVWGLLPGFFDSYRYAGVTSTSFCFPGCISAQRLATAAGLISLHFLLDDLLFDRDDVSVEVHGLHRDVRRDATSLEKFWFHLDTNFRSPSPPVNPIPIERAYWETGRQMQRDTSPEWFQYYADEVHRYFVAASAKKNENHVDVRDVNAYIDNRVSDGFGPHFIALLEFLNDIFLPSDLRADPRLQQLSHLCQVHLVLTNDIFSYEKEATQESNPLSLINLLMDTGCLSFAEAAKQAIELVNNVGHNFADIEAELPASLEKESLVYRYVLGLKQIITMNCEWHMVNKRYRTPNSRFPELRSEAV